MAWRTGVCERVSDRGVGRDHGRQGELAGLFWSYPVGTAVSSFVFLVLSPTDPSHGETEVLPMCLVNLLPMSLLAQLGGEKGALATRYNERRRAASPQTSSRRLRETPL